MPATDTPVIAYRPDIDGLRAVAVAAVVSFHVFPNRFPGGFIGVDIFFVISGYLISRIIMRDAEQGCFSFCQFYARRIRRIFPSLLTVLTATLAFGWFALLPEEYKALGKHVAGGAGFIDNFLLWFEAGYFDVESRAKPLLHLWSLGIEEQFYAVLPLGLWLCAGRWRRGFSLPLAVVCLLSFTVTLYLRGTNTTAAFYSPQSRFWELFAGCVLASFLRRPKTLQGYLVLDKLLARILHRKNQVGDGRCLSLCLALCGAGMLMCSLATAQGGETWPGWQAWLPVVGTVALIAAGPLNAISTYVLSNRFFVYVGKISYPLYLWHWPLIAFLYILQYPIPLNPCSVKISILILSFIFASFTYHTVEYLLRFKLRNRYIPLVLCVAMGCICILGIVIYIKDGVPSRVYSLEYTNEAERMEAIEKTYTNNCLQIFPDWEELNDNLCSTQSNLDTLDTIIIGDSHAGHLFIGLALAGTVHTFGVFPASGAAPYIDVKSFTRQGEEFRKNGCQLINRAYEVAVTHDNIKNVILSHRPYCSYVDIIDVQHPEDENRDRILERAMRRSFALLQAHHKHVIVILDTPASPIHPRNCVQRPYDLFTNYQMCRFSRRDTLDADAARNWYDGIVRRVAAEFEDISIVDLGNVFCDDSFCYLLQKNAIIYRDHDHLSRFGSRLVAPHILPHLR